MIAAILALTSEQIGVGTVSGLLIAFSAGVFKVYGQAQDDRRESAESRVESLEAELDRNSTRYESDRDAWAAEKKRLERALELARQELRDCWQDKIDKRRKSDEHT